MGEEKEVLKRFIVKFKRTVTDEKKYLISL